MSVGDRGVIFEVNEFVSEMSGVAESEGLLDRVDEL